MAAIKDDELRRKIMNLVGRKVPFRITTLDDETIELNSSTSMSPDSVSGKTRDGAEHSFKLSSITSSEELRKKTPF